MTNLSKLVTLRVMRWTNWLMIRLTSISLPEDMRNVVAMVLCWYLKVHSFTVPRLTPPAHKQDPMISASLGGSSIISRVIPKSNGSIRCCCSGEA